MCKVEKTFGRGVRGDGASPQPSFVGSLQSLSTDSRRTVYIGNLRLFSFGELCNSSLGPLQQFSFCALRHSFFGSLHRLLSVSLLSAITILYLGTSAAFADDPSVVEAQKLFKQYVELERSYDPTQADLFAPNAVIKDTRVYQDGQNKVLNWNGESYKQIVKAQLPVSKARAEQFIYSQPAFSREGNNVRLKCTRSSSTKKYAAPLEMVFAPGKNGLWKIVEESMQSQF